MNTSFKFYILFAFLTLSTFHLFAQKKHPHLSKKKQIELLNNALQSKQDSIRMIKYDVYDFVVKSLKLQEEKDSLLDEIKLLNSKKSQVRLEEIKVFNSLKTKEETGDNPFPSVKSPSDSKIWMTNDLNVTTFRNGDTLFHAQTNEQWKYAFDNNIPAFCYVNDNSSDGILYNWMAVNDPRGLAPYDWHIPTKNEFLLLNSSGVELKSTGGWGNAYCMNIKATGMRDAFSADFLSKGFASYYWTAEVGSSLKSWAFVLQNDYSKGTLTEERRENGYSVRCVKDLSDIGMGDGRGGKIGRDNGEYDGKGYSDPMIRIRLNDPVFDNIEVDIEVRVNLKMTIDENGQIVTARSTSKTTTTDQKIINRVISEVKRQVLYNKDPGTSPATVYLTVKLVPR